MATMIDIQKTKKVLTFCCLFIFLTFKLLGAERVKKSRFDIDRFVRLEIRVSSDSIKMGDTLLLQAIFTNISDEDVVFYPSATFFIIRPIVRFPPDSYLLSDSIVIENCELKAQEKITRTFRFPVGSFFKPGMNQINLLYVCKIKKKHNRYNAVLGSLQSKNVELFLL